MQRYVGTQRITSSLDPINDVLVLLEYLTARDYLVEILVKRHGLAKGEAQRRSQSIIPHVRTSLAYLRQAQFGPPELCFLPAYYGILNLLKVYVLFGPHHADLKAQRWHGASYPVDEKDSRSLLTEVVHLKKGGALPLYYKTVTGEAWPARTQIKMGEMYPYIRNVSAEYSIATGKPGKLALLKLERGRHKHKGKRTCTVVLLRRQGDSKVYSVRDFKVLRFFRRHPSDPNRFVGRAVAQDCKVSDLPIRQQFRLSLVYSSGDQVMLTPVSSSRLLVPEELPIALLFFHMSSVVRYKPEFLERIRTSRCWPIMSAARQHCVLRMLILAWSFFHQENLAMTHQMP